MGKKAIVDSGFVNRLQEAIRLAYMKQVELAESTGLSEAAISSMLKGKYVPSIGTLRNLALMLRVSVEWLAEGKGSMRPSEHGEPFISKDERDLISKYRNAPKEIQEHFTGLLDIYTTPRPEIIDPGTIIIPGGDMKEEDDEWKEDTQKDWNGAKK